MTEQRVGDMMVKNVMTIKPQQTLGDAVKIMGEYGIRHLIVVRDEKRPVGLFSQRVVFQHLARVWNKGEQPSEIPVSEFMTTDMVTVSPSTPVHRAAQIMAARRLVVYPWSQGAGSSGLSLRSIFFEVQPGMFTESDSSD